MAIILFFAQNHPHSIFHMEDIFLPKNDFVWSIQHANTKQWLTPQGTMTSYPTEAMHFETQMKALSYCIQNKMGEEYIQTEHQLLT